MPKTLLGGKKMTNSCNGRDRSFVKVKDDTVSLIIGLVNMSWATFICAKSRYEEGRQDRPLRQNCLMETPQEAVLSTKIKAKPLFLSIWGSHLQRFFLVNSHPETYRNHWKEYQLQTGVKLYCKSNILPQIITNCVTSTAVKGHAEITKSTVVSRALASEIRT